MVQVPLPLQLSLPCPAFRWHACAACTLEPWSIGCCQPNGCLWAGEFGSGFGRVCCRMFWKPKVGFVQGLLGLMLSRHMLFPTRKPSALCKISFSFFFLLPPPPPLCHHAVGEDAVYPTHSFLLPRRCRWRNRSTSAHLQVWLPSVDVLSCLLS